MCILCVPIFYPFPLTPQRVNMFTHCRFCVNWILQKYRTIIHFRIDSKYTKVYIGLIRYIDISFNTSPQYFIKKVAYLSFIMDTHDVGEPKRIVPLREFSPCSSSYICRRLFTSQNNGSVYWIFIQCSPSSCTSAVSIIRYKYIKATQKISSSEA